MLGVAKSEVFTFPNLFLVLAVFIGNAEGKCTLQLSPEETPLLTEKFGSKVIIFPNWKQTIELNQNEEIGAYCGSGFSPFQTYEPNYYGQQYFNKPNVQKLNLECRSDNIYISTKSEDSKQVYLYNNPTIKCKGDAYSLFESKNALLNCDTAMSYVVGANTTTPIILAGLCYDLNKLNLNYVTYRMQNRNVIMDNVKEYYPVGVNDGSLLEPLNNIEHFFQLQGDLSVFFISSQSGSRFLLSAADYEKANIIRTFTDVNDLSPFHKHPNMLDIFWWRPLKIGNWNRFAELLKKRAESVNYIIYSGTSGAAQLPRKNDCENDTDLEAHFPGIKKVVPQFIWMYLESTDENIFEDFVVIGYNSPFFDYFPRNSTVICNDMCDDIEWMKEIKDSRYITTLGVLYCCHPEEIAEYLDGFPKIFNETNLVADITPTP